MRDRERGFPAEWWWHSITARCGKQHHQLTCWWWVTPSYVYTCSLVCATALGQLWIYIPRTWDQIPYSICSQYLSPLVLPYILVALLTLAFPFFYHGGFVVWCILFYFIYIYFCSPFSLCPVVEFHAICNHCVVPGSWPAARISGHLDRFIHLFPPSSSLLTGYSDVCMCSRDL